MRKLTLVIAAVVLLSLSGPLTTVSGSNTVTPQGQANTGR